MREPDLVGHGRAWVVTAKPQNVDQTATLKSWLLRGPWHPMWSAWVVSVIHLRDVPGQSKPPTKRTPDSSHEFLIMSLQSPPSSPYDPDPDDFKDWHILMPPDMATQVEGISDEQAVKLLDKIVNTIIDGNASPDSDYRSYWTSSIRATAAHLRAGLH